MNETILKSGIKVITQKNENSNVCTLSYTVKSGSFDELEHERGIAHLVEHMLFKGTINRDYLQINQDIENVGGYLNAFTTYQMTNYYCTVPSDCWKTGLDIISDLVFNSTIPEDELVKEKLVVQEELKMYADDLSSFTIEKLMENIFENYDNRKSVGGTVESVGKINRDNIIDFISRNYFPSNMVFVATGNVNHEEIVEFIDSYINKLNIDFIEYEKTYDSFTPHDLNCKTIVYNKSEIEQTHLAFGMFICGADDIDMPALKILNSILGGSSTSILFNTIREKMGLAYTISTNIEEMNDISLLYGYAGLNSDNDINIVINKILDEILNVEEKIDEILLERVKKYITGMTYIQLEKSSEENIYISQKELFGSSYNVEDSIQAINNVTLEDLKNVINRYITKENILFTILKSK